MVNVSDEQKVDYTLDVEKSKFVSWSFTYKKSGKADNVKSSDYLHILTVLKRHGNVTRNYYEKDSKGKWHVHGVVELPKGFYRARVCLPGYHVHFKEIWNEEGWEDYMRKDQLLGDKTPAMVQESPGPLKIKDDGLCPSDDLICEEPSPSSMMKRPEIQAGIAQNSKDTANATLHYLFGETLEFTHS